MGIAVATVVFGLVAPIFLVRAQPPTTQPQLQSQQRLTIEYSGPVRLNPYAPAPAASTDPNARAATWRYYYSAPAFYYCGYPYGGWYGWRAGFYHYGRPYWIGIEFNGCY
jgi:hypothetical protein